MSNPRLPRLWPSVPPHDELCLLAIVLNNNSKARVQQIGTQSRRYQNVLYLNWIPYRYLPGKLCQDKSTPAELGSQGHRTLTCGQFSRGRRIPQGCTLSKMQWFLALYNNQEVGEILTRPLQVSPLRSRSQSDKLFHSTYHHPRHLHCLNGRVRQWPGSVFLISSSRVWTCLGARHGGKEALPTVEGVEGYQIPTSHLFKSRSRNVSTLLTTVFSNGEANESSSLSNVPATALSEKWSFAPIYGNEAGSNRWTQRTI